MRAPILGTVRKARSLIGFQAGMFRCGDWENGESHEKEAEIRAHIVLVFGSGYSDA